MEENIYNEVKLYIKDKGYVDVDNTFPVSLNYRVADIADISKRGGSYSKTITVKGTKNNNQLFSQLYNIRSSDFTFNLNVKYQAVVYCNGINIFEGYVQLDNIIKSPSNNAWNEDSIIGYNIILYNSAVDFFTTISDKYLTDIDFNLYPHNLVPADIMATTGNTYLDTYKYINLYNTNQDYTVQDFWPAIFAVNYVDRIFTDAGYHYNNSSLHTGDFGKILIPFTGKDFKKDAGTLSDESFYVQMSADTFDSAIYPTHLYKTIVFDDCTTYPFFQNTYGEPDITTGVYQVNTGGYKNFKVDYNFHVVYNNAWYARLWIQLWKNGSYLTQISAGPATVWGDQPSNAVGSVNFTNIAALNGDNFQVKIEFIYGRINTSLGASVSLYTKAGTAWGLTQTDCVRYYGDEVQINDYIPKNVKQKDFVSNLLKMFNIYLDVDKSETNKFLLKTRDAYYSTAVYHNWSSKIDRSKEQQIKYLPDLQNKEITFTYKNAEDEFSKLYQQNYNEVFGQKKIVFNTETITGEDKKELIFNDTPNVYCRNLIVPAIDSRQPSGLHILYDGGLINGNWTFADTGNSITYSYSAYTYAGHFDNPTEPDFDLNFGSCKAYFTDNFWTTENNVFNLYHYNTIKQISEGKQLTAWFLLNESDIATLNLSDKIVIDNVIYIINEIKDYNPAVKNSLTQVSLNTWEDCYSLVPQKKKKIVATAHTMGNISIATLLQQQNNFSNIIASTAIVNHIKGKKNIISDYADEILIEGNGNTVGASCRNISLYSCSDCVVEDGVSNVRAFNCSGLTIDSKYEGASIVGGNIIRSDSTVFTGSVSTNIISAETLYVSGFTGLGDYIIPRSTLHINSFVNNWNGGYITFEGGSYGSSSIQQWYDMSLWSSNSYARNLGGTGFAYDSNNAASQILQAKGKIHFNVAPVGLSGNILTWATAVTIDNSGNVGIGTIAPEANFEVTGATLLNALSATTIYSGSTDLYNIFQTIGGGSSGASASVSVQNGLNTYTGGTESLPTINISAATLNNLQVSGSTSLGVLSASTIYSGSTNLYSTILSIVTGITSTLTGSSTTSESVGGLLYLFKNY